MGLAAGEKIARRVGILPGCALGLSVHAVSAKHVLVTLQFVAESLDNIDVICLHSLRILRAGHGLDLIAHALGEVFQLFADLLVHGAAV